MPCRNNIGSVVKRAATICYIWNARDIRLFQSKKQSIKSVKVIICEHIRLKLLSLKVIKTLAVKRIAEKWSTQMNYHM